MIKHLESLCGGRFWDPKAIYSSQPDFTFCFHNTVLLWMPCAVLWLVAPLWIYMLTRQSEGKIRISWILISKSIVTILLISIETIHIIRAYNRNEHLLVYFLTPYILIMTYILVLFLIHFERIRNLKSSTLVFIFFGLLTLDSIVTLRSKIIHYFNHKSHDVFGLYLFIAFFVLICLNTILTLFSEQDVANYEQVINKDDTSSSSRLKKMPENNVSLMSKLWFWWINDLIKTGFKRDLIRDDLWEIDDSETSIVITKRLENAWNEKANDYINKIREHPELEKPVKIKPPKENKKLKKENYKNGNKSEEEIKLNILDKTQVEIKQPSGKYLQKPSLGFCLCYVFGGKFLAGSFIKLIQDCFIFIGPYLLDKLITFIKDKEQNILVGLFYTFLLFICSLIQSFVLQHYFHRMFIVGTRVRTSLMNIVYKKSLRLSTTARRMATVGEMTNLIAVNAQSFAELTTYLNIIWSAPFQITICIIGLWRYLGVSCLFGVGTMVFFIPLNLTIANKSKQLQLTKLKYQDSRIKMMNEIFAGIKVIKLYGWELSFQNIVNRIRTDELSYLKKMGYLNMVSSFLWMCAPLIVSIVSFGTFVLIDSNNVLDANTAFVSISLFNILRFPLTVLPGVIAALINAMVSLSRIRNFLLRDEIKQDDITYDETPGVAISLNNVDLGWDAKSAEVNLKNLDLQIDQGKLVAVVGQVGCGKSSLISGILGEMHKLNDGKINLNGSSAYVAQQAWIQNATVRDNILFGKDYNQKLYEKVIESCSLKTDFQIMPAGDSTEIGEKGINLSGGQKQRISLARSVYVNADIYLLDDPLSAVDAHVGKDIFDNIIGPNGLLKDKTRVFVTNSLSFLPQVDEIILLENGQIVEKGTYEQLKNKNGAFTDFIRLYLQSQDFNKNNQQINEELGEKTPEQKRPATGQSIDILARQQSNKSKVEASVEKVVEKAGEKIIVKEKIESGEVKLSILKAYFKACGYVLTGLSVILFSIVNIGSIGSNVWLSEWSNDAKNPSLASDNKMYRLIVYAALGFAQCGITLLSDYFFVLMFLRASQSLHLRMLESILRSTIEFFESTPSGRIINRFSKDVDAIEKSIPESFKSLFRCFFHVLFTILVISASTPLFLAALVPIIVIYVFVQRYFVSSMRQLKRLESASKSPIFSHFTETQTGVSTIRAYRVQNRFINTMESRINENLIYYFPNNISNRWLALRLELIGNLITVFAALFAVIARDSISAGIAGLSISYSLNVSQTLNWLVRMSADFETNITSAERIEEYCNTPHENEWSIKETKPSLEWPQNGEIKIENYSVKYRDNLDNVLNDMNAQIKPGEKIGIVGRTGAGKSSLTLSLFRILENSVGKIIIDGVDIKSIGLHDLRHKLTIIPQEPVLFSGTLLMNLDPLQTYKDETKIWLALEHAHLKHFVLGLDKQLNFECTEGGENLSVGQRQLICLARALLRKTKILILDEATASVDHNTDELIQNTIRTEFADCTVLTIAHRLNTIMDSSRIMVLDKGKIVEFDTPKQLLSNKNGIFYSMAKDANLV